MTRISRREILGSAAVVGGWMALGSAAALGQTRSREEPAEAGGPYSLPPLPYGYADLEPFLDAQTLKLHHDIHHAGYVKGANAAVAELARIRSTGGDAIREVRTATDRLSFNLSGHLLHSLFWQSMKRDGGGDPAEDSVSGQMLRRDFGTVDGFRATLAAAAAQVQGSGWAVLVYEPQAQRLMVLQAEKHQNRGVWGAVPLLALDVWEHAYYLLYQNRRTEFINAFMQVINWDSVERQLQAALGAGKA
jgi:Fe-Mn family superoxide dismutase